MRVIVDQHQAVAVRGDRAKNLQIPAFSHDFERCFQSVHAPVSLVLDSARKLAQGRQLHWLLWPLVPQPPTEGHIEPQHLQAWQISQQIQQKATPCVIFGIEFAVLNKQLTQHRAASRQRPLQNLPRHIREIRLY